MHAQDRAAVILGIVALLAFLVRWPIDNYICNPETWKSATATDVRGNDLLWRPTAQEGMSFFTTVFRGGAGTPAIFAMLGGQRYMVANILWNYSDVLFHKGQPYDMVPVMESAVTLNPTFIEAWSVYGWHMAWNLNAYSDEPVLKAKYLRQGEQIYLRAIHANPKTPRPYFDLAWLYLQRVGDYERAMYWLQQVVESDEFTPLTPEERKNRDPMDPQLILERKWDPAVYGRRLGYVYTKMGLYTRDDSYFEKAIATYERCLEIDSEDEISRRLAGEVRENMHNEAWIAEKLASDAAVRRNFGMSPRAAFHGTDSHVKPDPDEAP